MFEKYFSHGKLLITGEYLVIKGANALALPVNLGQSLETSSNSLGQLNWLTLEKGCCIFTANFSLVDFEILGCSDSEKAAYISNLLRAARTLNPNFLIHSKGCSVNTNIEFNMQWGLGSSSTLINNVAQWSKVNPFDLNRLISNGSGYDIACAAANGPITYQIVDNKLAINAIEFNPPFLDNLTLVYLNIKMATENNITTFLQSHTIIEPNIENLNVLTQKFIVCKLLSEFMELLTDHENIIASVINQTPVKQLLFSDFEGSIKSLGAWGGDFILAASENNFEKQRKYFNNKGYTTVIPLKELMI